MLKWRLKKYDHININYCMNFGKKMTINKTTWVERQSLIKPAQNIDKIPQISITIHQISTNCPNYSAVKVLQQGSQIVYNCQTRLSSSGGNPFYMRRQIASAIAEAGIEVLPPFLLQYVLFVYMPETKKLEFQFLFLTPQQGVFIGD